MFNETMLSTTKLKSSRRVSSRRIDPTLPTMYDLPYENPLTDDMPDYFHQIQPQLLNETFVPPNYPYQQVLVATDLYLYYDLEHTLWYKRPDWFAVLGVPRGQTVSELRYSYVMWQEKVAPYLIVELLSTGTEAEDLGKPQKPSRQPLNSPAQPQPPRKWEVYERILQVPYYLVYSRKRLKLQAFKLVNGRYQEVEITGQGFWLPEVQLGIGLWAGRYQKVNGRWARFYDAQGSWLPTEAEARQAEAQARHSAEQQAKVAEEARHSAEQRADAEAQARQNAEQQAKVAEKARQAEAQARHSAEQRAAVLEAELARLKALLEP